MVYIQAVSHGTAGLAVAATLVILCIDLVALWILAYLIRDQRTLLAAERMEVVELSTLMQRHLPPERQTHIFSDEHPLAKEIVDRKTRRWRKMVLAASSLLVATGLTASSLVRANIMRITAASMVEPAPPPINPLMSIVGVWGWKYEVLKSCSENPLTLTLNGNRTRLSARFAKAVWDGGVERNGFEYDIVGVEPGILDLKLSGSENLTDQAGRPIGWYITFLDANTLQFARKGWKDDATPNSTGNIVRCN